MGLEGPGLEGTIGSEITEGTIMEAADTGVVVITTIMDLETDTTEDIMDLVVVVVTTEAAAPDTTPTNVLKPSEEEDTGRTGTSGMMTAAWPHRLQYNNPQR